MAAIGIMNKCLFYRVKKSGGAGMLFSFPAPFLDCPPLFSFFPSFFPLFFPKRGSPLMPWEGSGYRLPSLRLCPSAPPHLFTFLCPYLEISRSPPCVECKHSHLLCSERKQGQLIGTVLIWPWPLCAGWKPCPFVYGSGAYGPLQVVRWLGLYFLPTWLQQWR